MGYEKKQLATPESKQARFQRVNRRNEDKSRRNKELVEMKDAASVLMEMSTVTNRSGHLNDSFESLVPLDHVDDKENETGADIHDPCLKKISSLQRENRQLLYELSVLQDELRETRNKFGSAKFGDAFLTGGARDARTVFYTGIPTHAVFLWLVQFCTSVLPTSMKLNPASLLMLVLMKLRLNTADMDLGYRFGVSRQHVSDLIDSTLPPLAKKLAFLIQWPDKEEVIRHMPKVIKRTYKNCRVIIDCCEIFTERTGNLTARAMTWSNYKSHNTVKLLVAVSPVGAVTFVSRAFGGRLADKLITQRSGFLQLLEQGDLVLADRGVFISDELAACGAQLAIRAFTKGKAQLCPKDIETGRQLSRVRIHVKRAIERLKNFKVLSTSMKINLVPHADNIVTICSAITNLHPKLIA